MRKFDTCFFERYAKQTLTHFLGHSFDDLINKDRPDLQSPDHRRVGIEVTRAMEESKKAADMLLGEMAGLEKCEDDQEMDLNFDLQMQQILDTGYGYGLQHGQYIGIKELEYWRLALPMQRILESKISKAANGFYGNFDSLGLYVFSKDDLTDESVAQTCSYVRKLQKDNAIRYDVLYLSEVSNLYVCQLHGDFAQINCFPITPERRYEFFINSI